MYSRNQKTEAISARLAPGLKDRIDFECQQHPGWNRNKFLNRAAELLLDTLHEVRAGNVSKYDLLPQLQRFIRTL